MTDLILSAPLLTGLDQSGLPSALNWLNDAPLLIDEKNLARFYDAVVRPPYKEAGPRTIKISQGQKSEIEGKLGAKGKIGLPDWISALFSAGGGSLGRWTSNEGVKQWGGRHSHPCFD